MKLSKLIVKNLLKLHTFVYKLITVFSIKAENGLHPKHRLINYHKFFVDNVNSDDLVLDIGCGNGALAFYLAKKAKKVVGVDWRKKNIEFAKENFSAPNIEYLIGDATKDLPEQKFGVIVLSNVLEHIKDRVEFLAKIKNLAPKILIRAPMVNRSWISLYKKELGLDWKLDKSHFTEYTLESFKDELNQAGLFIQNYSIQFGEIWSIVSVPKGFL